MASTDTPGALDRLCHGLVATPDGGKSPDSLLGPPIRPCQGEKVGASLPLGGIDVQIPHAVWTNGWGRVGTACYCLVGTEVLAPHLPFSDITPMEEGGCWGTSL